MQTQTPFIVVPFPHAMDNHQYLNAKYYSDKGCCWIIEQHDFSVINLFNLIVEIIKDRQKLKFARENNIPFFGLNKFINVFGNLNTSMLY